MVLQRGQPVQVWGRAAAGTVVEVQLADQRRRAITDAGGFWRIELAPLEATRVGMPLVVVAGAEELRLEDVVVGEVWLASGQSNMEMPVLGDWARVLEAEAEVARSEDPLLRMFTVARRPAADTAADVTSDRSWQLSSPDTAGGFSAAAYFFARRLRRHLDVPVGIIHSSWGGTQAEAWTSADALERLGGFDERLAAVRASVGRDPDALRREYENAVAERKHRVVVGDAGVHNGRPVWADPDLDDAGWLRIPVPGTWEGAGLPGLDGVVWVRREVNVPSEWAGQELRLSLGSIDDEDVTYWNGREVGRDHVFDARRHYTVPAELVRAGRNLLAIRIYDGQGDGGLWGRPEELRVQGPADVPVALAGEWRYRVGLDLATLPSLPFSPDDPNQPSVLYNGMIRPLAPFGLRGVVWYQGEANTGRAHEYRSLFPALIRDWRRTWDIDLPFFFVQLANYQHRADEPGESDWAELREAQREALALPGTGMAVAIDIGEDSDIHPKNKQAVGNRLARLALRRVYGWAVADTGPQLRDFESAGERLRLRFTEVSGGLEAQGGVLSGFAVAGEDRVWHWAQARIVRPDTVEVWSSEVPAPVAARYGWASNPRANLYDSAGLPASPFRTDDWPWTTRPPQESRPSGPRQP